MANAKVTLNGQVLIDLTSDTVKESNLLLGITAHSSDGTSIVGTYVAPSGTIESLTVTPSTAAQTFNDSNVDGYKPVTVNAIPSNYIDTTDATAAASQIYSGKTAYVNGQKVTGTAEVTVSGTTLVMPAGLITIN